jgi:hypothetical protein
VQSSLTWPNSSTAKASLLADGAYTCWGSESVAALAMFGTNLEIEQELKVRKMES